MPPKKGKTTSSKAAAVQPAATTTSRRGKETTATAATDRPRRVSSSANLDVSVESATKSSSTPASNNKRGRPRKSVEEESPKKRSRGKGGRAIVSKDVEDENEDETKDDEVEDEEEETVASPKARRSSQAKTEPANAKRAPGRPRKAAGVAEASSNAEPPKRRGRPPKGGETTQISADAQAAASQLEEELEEEQQAAAKPSTGGKVQSTKKGRGKAKKADGVVDAKDAAAGEEDEESAPSGPRYWLMKAEQEDRIETLKSGRDFNTKFTIDDLRSKTVPEPWDGVRNAVAAKHMRNMKKGDLAFFYASGGKSGRTPGITGIMEIVKEHEPDVTTSDEDAYGYVEKESDRGKWCVVHVEFRKKLSKPVSLKELQKYSEANGVLADMQVLRLARLSVTAVSEKEWDFIVNKLVDGYDDDDEAPTREVKDGDEIADNIEVRVEVPITASTTASGTKPKTNESKTDAEFTAEVTTAAPDNKPSSRSACTQSTSQGSRQSSRVASRQALQSLPSRPGHSESARTVSRGRSRTGRLRDESSMASVEEEASADSA